jgi:catalase-peroxidase
VRETFARMAMNDEETAALTCWRAHRRQVRTATATRAARPGTGRRPDRSQGFGWDNPNMGGKAEGVTSGLEGAWTTNPTKWDMGYFDLLFGYEWELTKSPAGANQWEPIDIKEEDKPVDPTIRPSRHNPIMTDADMAMKMDPIYNARSARSSWPIFDYFSGHVRAGVVQADPPRYGSEGRYSARTCRRKI